MPIFPEKKYGFFLGGERSTATKLIARLTPNEAIGQPRNDRLTESRPPFWFLQKMVPSFEALGQLPPSQLPQRTPRTNAPNSTENAIIFQGEELPILRGARLTATEALAELNHFSQLTRTENRVILSYLEWKRMSSPFEALGQLPANQSPD